MKLAMTGKGGVGKTTFCALLATAFAKAGHPVLAVDADPNSTLAACLGVPSPEDVPILSELSDLIEERTGVKPGTPGSIYKLNPRVDDLPERFAVEHQGVRLLRMGAVKDGGSGCYCPENALLKSLVSHLFLGRQDVLVMDMEAGVEHFGRGTAGGVDCLVIVVEATRQSLATAARIQRLASDIGLTTLAAAANKIRDDRDLELLTSSLGSLPLLGAIPYSEEVRQAEVSGQPPDPDAPAIKAELDKIMNELARLAAA